MLFQIEECYAYGIPLEFKKMKKARKTTYFASFDQFFSFFGVISSFFVIILTICCFHSVCLAQGIPDQELDDLYSLIQDLIENQEEDIDFELNTVFEELVNRYNHPKDLNTASFADLQSLLFLSDIDVNNIIGHKNTYGHFIDIYELQAVQGLSLEKARVLSKLYYVNSQRNAPTSYITDRSEIFLKAERKIQTERGFQNDQGESPQYSGDPNYLYLRIAYKNTEVADIGMTLEKDAGEKWVSNGESSTDFRSAYISKSNITPFLKSIIVGDFTANFGQGLILLNGFGTGKSSYTTTLKRGQKPIRPYSSADENIFLRGIGTEWKMSKMITSTFLVSHSAIDGNLLLDPDGMAIAFSSFQRSGLHRTENELTDKDGVDQTAFGTSIKYENQSGNRLTINGLYIKYSKPLERTDQLYNKFRFQGDNIFNISTDFNTYWNSINFFGELAYADTGGWAKNVNALTSIHPKLDLAINYRDYDRDFQAPLSNAFGEGSQTENEEGLYIGLEMRPNKEWKINAYGDFWYNEWLRFGVDAPSNGTEYLLKIENIIKRKRSTYVQYRYERKQENADTENRTSFITDRALHRLRLHNQYVVNDQWELRSRIELSSFSKEKVINQGILIYQDIIYNANKIPLTINSRLTYFNVENFDARIYAFEKDLLYEFSIPFYTGKGWRYYSYLRYQLNKQMTAEIRYSNTHYVDGRESSGSGNTRIDGNNLTHIKAQMRYRF